MDGPLYLTRAEDPIYVVLDQLRLHVIEVTEQVKHALALAMGTTDEEAYQFIDHCKGMLCREIEPEFPNVDARLLFETYMALGTKWAELEAALMQRRFDLERWNVKP